MHLRSRDLVDVNLAELGDLSFHWQQGPNEMADLALDAESGRAMAIQQRCVNVSSCGGQGQELVVATAEGFEVLASIVVSPQQPNPERWIASDRWQLNLALVAAVAEHWLSHCAACLLAQEMLCCTKGTDVSHEANGEAVCPGVCELLQLAMLKYFFFKVIKLLSAQVMQRGCSCSVLSALPCSCCPVLSVLLCSCCSAAAAPFNVRCSAALSIDTNTN